SDDCVLTDYKTGAPDEHHTDQLRLYALLWSRDEQVNPRRLRASSLVIAYTTHDELIDGPEQEELEALGNTLENRVSRAEGTLARRPPPAHPAPDMCRLCSVRQLCDDYWESEAALANSPHGAPSGSFVD